MLLDCARLVDKRPCGAAEYLHLGRLGWVRQDGVCAVVSDGVCCTHQLAQLALYCCCGCLWPVWCCCWGGCCHDGGGCCFGAGGDAWGQGRAGQHGGLQGGWMVLVVLGQWEWGVAHGHPSAVALHAMQLLQGLTASWAVQPQCDPAHPGQVHWIHAAGQGRQIGSAQFAAAPCGHITV
eukprot:1158787-Pelagomonas_calceolata.AAC.1